MRAIPEIRLPGEKQPGIAAIFCCGIQQHLIGIGHHLIIDAPALHQQELTISCKDRTHATLALDQAQIFLKTG